MIDFTANCSRRTGPRFLATASKANDMNLTMFLRRRVTTFAYSAMSSYLLFVLASQPCDAHEGHAALPSHGVTVERDQLLISPAAIKAIGMETESVKLGDISRSIRVNARIELPWSGHATVTTLAAGKVAEILVAPGDTVQAGQQIARLVSLNVETLQAKLLQATAEIELLERLVRQRRPLVESGGIAKKSLMETQAKLKKVQAEQYVTWQELLGLGVDADDVTALLDENQSIRYVPLRAPISGTIEAIEARTGQRVESTDELFRIVDASTLYVVGEVLEGDAHQVQPGQQATIWPAGLTNHPISGTVDHIRMKIDETTRAVEAVVRVENPDNRLRAGMFGRMDVKVLTATQEIICPSVAITETESEVFVLRQEYGGTFSRCPIKVGMRSTDVVVIKSGLFPGQRIVTRGSQLLAAMFDHPSAAKISSQSPDSATEPTSPNAALTKKPIFPIKSVVELPTNHQAFATSLIEGRITAINVAPNEMIEAGQALAEVASRPLHSWELELIQAKAEMDWVQSEVNRLQPLAESGATSAAEYWQRQLDTKTVQQQITSITRRLELVGRQGELPAPRSIQSGISDDHSRTSLGRISITSPISGRVADIGLSIGQIVHADDHLFEIQDNGTVWIKAFVSEADAPHVMVGQHAVTTFPSRPALQVSGKTVRVASQLVSQERVLPIWIEIPNADGFLKTGMLANVVVYATATTPNAADAVRFKMPRINEFPSALDHQTPTVQADHKNDS